MLHRLIVVLSAGLLASCSQTPAPESPGPNQFGVAVRSNMQAQIIAGEGEIRALGPAPGVRRALSIGRYQTDQVEQPVEVYTRAE